MISRRIPKESGFTKAMNVAKGRTITILDHQGIVFSRIWCVFELFLTLVVTKGSKDGVLAVYTAFTHTYAHPDNNKPQEQRKTIGIISGGATSDLGQSEYITAREAAFPNNLVENSMSIRVEVAEASVADDKIHILNSIIRRSTKKFNAVPLTTHDKYEELNNSLGGTFASSIASLARAAKDPSDEGWEKMTVALSKGIVQGTMEFQFKSGGVWDGLTAMRATQLVAHLPLTINTLKIWNAEYSFEFWDALIDQLSQCNNLKELRICESHVSGEEGGKQALSLRLAEIMCTNTTIKDLSLFKTDLIGVDDMENWGDALMNNNNTLIVLSLTGARDEIGNHLKTKTKDRIPKLKMYL